jgi:hypothetical protein
MARQMAEAAINKLKYLEQEQRMAASEAIVRAETYSRSWQEIEYQLDKYENKMP